MRKVAILFLIAHSFFLSCSKDDHDGVVVDTSRTLQYNITGNFSGNLYMSYTTASGGTVNEQVASLPGNKEITFDANVTAANVVISGNGGTAGQQVILVVKRGGNAVGGPTVATADASGSFTKAAPVVFF